MKILYVSDLDGTLLNGVSRISDRTACMLNGLMAKGMIFTYATARSLTTAAKVTESLRGCAPAVVYNGTFTVDVTTGQRLRSIFFSKEEASRILDVLETHGISPTVFADIEGRERMTYCPALLSDGMRAFRSSRHQDDRNRPVDTPVALHDGQIFHISCIDTPQRLLPAYEILRKTQSCLYYTDPQSSVQWLEMAPCGATKAHAAFSLKNMLGCDRLVCFGDGINDLPLFQVADECYAVANACAEVKAAATGIIGSNDEDGVAEWLLTHFAP